MRKSVLFNLFAALDKADRRAMKKYVRSIYFNKREDVVQLYDYFNDKYEGKSSAFDKETVFEHIYRGEPYDDKKMRYVMSFLLKNVEQYLVSKKREKDEVRNNLELMKIYREMGIEKGFLRSQKEATTHLDKSNIKAINYYENAYLLEYEKLLFKEGHRRIAPRNLQEVSHSLDLAFLTKKIKQSCLSLAHESVYNVQYDSSFLDLVLDYLEERDWLEMHPAISLYFYYYRAETEEDGYKYFEKLKLGIIKDGDLLPNDELKTLYLAAINYSIKRLNKGEKVFFNESFQLYKAGLEQKILIENGSLSRFTFFNIAKNAFYLNEYDWVEKFLLNYSDFIKKKYRKQYVSVINSHLHYNKKEYKESLDLIHEIEFDDLFLALNTKTLQLKIYYELEEFDLLTSFVISYQRFLERKKTISYHKELYKNLIRFVRKMLESNLYDKAVKDKLIEEIKDTTKLAQRKWLLEMLEKKN